MNRQSSVVPTKSFHLLCALVAGAILAGCSDTPSNGAADRPSPEPNSSLPALSDDKELLYLDGTTLERFDIESGTQTRIVRLPTLDVSASRSTEWIAYVIGIEVAADDFIESPVLHLRNVTTGEDIEVGPGFSPLWHPLDDRLAFLQPVEPRNCEVETCRGGVTVAVAGPGTDIGELLPAGRWGLLTWAGDHLLVVDGSDLSHTVVAHPDGRSELDVSPSEVWDASPDGRWLVTVGPAGAELHPLEAGVPAGAPVDIDLGDAVLGDGSWSPDSSRLAATVRAGGRAQVAVVGSEDPEARPLAGSDGATGALLWSPSGSGVTLTRSTPGGRRLEAAYCPVDSGARCRGLFSWVQDVVLLRME